MAVTDIILLLIMFVGLLRLRRRHGGGTFGLARLLWKQVRWLFFSPAVVNLVYGMSSFRD
jgi:hypothetical protein